MPTIPIPMRALLLLECVAVATSLRVARAAPCVTQTSSRITLRMGPPPPPDPTDRGIITRIGRTWDDVLDYLTNMGGYTGFSEEQLKSGGAKQVEQNLADRTPLDDFGQPREYTDSRVRCRQRVPCMTTVCLRECATAARADDRRVRRGAYCVPNPGPRDRRDSLRPARPQLPDMSALRGHSLTRAHAHGEAEGCLTPFGGLWQ